ncbi:von Willebrand factor type A domain containing protein [Planoprotostelium fungivorum]|uniref:von Willebrand factor type A domain containing protein n=1 Tax=Planoprotostelium fungivorum TaxID=1890364 RepID=A0A2P6MPD1_9EUKA|nr:von Willebrand factor type A domain containing protein [Planoprotostelium fungivorum]
MRPLNIFQKKNDNKGKANPKPNAKADKKEEEKKDQVFPTQYHGDKTQEDGPVTLSINTIGSQEANVHVSITPPPTAKRCPVDIVCVVDISGSMSSVATTKDAQGVAESSNMSMLDLVSHAVRTVASALDEGDRLSLVAFDDSAEERFALQNMNDTNKMTLYAKAHELQTRGGTNIWAGLEAGMNSLNKATAVSGRRLGAVVLLTDGQPTTSPPKGEAEATRAYIEKNAFPGSVSTFGFGYGINTKMLSGIAKAAQGSYTFIPDSTILGTAFVNWTSNFLSSAADRAVLSLEPLNGATFSSSQPDASHVTTSWGLQYSIGTISYGQTRDVVVNMTIPSDHSDDTPHLRATLKYFNGRKSVEVETEKSTRDNELEVRYQLARVRAATVISQHNLRSTQDLIQDIEKEETLASEPRVAALLQDLKGQVIMGLEPNAYETWGKHFLVSLEMTHSNQLCNNFKDPGVQHYGGELFKGIRDDLDDIFVKLPPPKRAAAIGHVDMQQYYNCYGGCFHENSLVTMATGEKKKAKEVEKGDSVITGGGTIGTIRCVLKTVMSGGFAELCRVGDLYVTPYHPVKLEDSWKFPVDVSEKHVVPCGSVYTFLLEQGCSVVVDDVETITLAHGITGDEVAAHEFFGTQKIVDAMRGCAGFDAGCVAVKPSGFLRGEDGRVCGLRQETEVEEILTFPVMKVPCVV